MADDPYEEWVEQHLERLRGLHTKTDREFLLGNLDYKRYDDPQNAETQLRFQMRKRIRDSILDFAILMRRLPESDARQLFEESARRIDESEAADLRGTVGESPELESGFQMGWQGAIALFYHGLGTTHP